MLLMMLLLRFGLYYSLYSVDLYSFDGFVWRLMRSVLLSLYYTQVAQYYGRNYYYINYEFFKVLRGGIIYLFVGSSLRSSPACSLFDYHDAFTFTFWFVL